MWLFVQIDIDPNEQLYIGVAFLLLDTTDKSLSFKYRTTKLVSSSRIPV